MDEKEETEKFITYREYAQRHAELEKPLAILAQRMDRLAADRESDAKKLDSLESSFTALARDFAILQTRVGMYAAGGALIGGSLVGLVFDALRVYFHVGP